MFETLFRHSDKVYRNLDTESSLSSIRLNPILLKPDFSLQICVYYNFFIPSLYIIFKLVISIFYVLNFIYICIYIFLKKKFSHVYVYE